MTNLKDSIRKHFEPIFLAYDIDNSKTLQKPQLKALLADNLGVTINEISQQQLDWHFKKIDANGDGKITFQEYFNNFFGDRAKSSLKSHKKQGEEELIDKSEFRKLMEDTFKPLKIQITEEMVNWNFAQIDTDNSGRITFQQYMQFINKYN